MLLQQTAQSKTAWGKPIPYLSFFVILSILESSPEDQQREANQQKQVSAFDLPAQWKPNGANETGCYKCAIRWIPNGANEAVLTSCLLQWIPNGANEAAILFAHLLQWIPYGANEAVSNILILIALI